LFFVFTGFTHRKHHESKNYLEQINEPVTEMQLSDLENRQLQSKDTFQVENPVYEPDIETQQEDDEAHGQQEQIEYDHGIENPVTRSTCTRSPIQRYA
jgi:hypothetical protein